MRRLIESSLLLEAESEPRAEEARDLIGVRGRAHQLLHGHSIVEGPLEGRSA